MSYNTPENTWAVLNNKNVYSFREVDNIELEVLCNGEPNDWMVRYEAGEGYACVSPDTGEMLDDMYFETLEEIEAAFETWDIKIAHYQNRKAA